MRDVLGSSHPLSAAARPGRLLRALVAAGVLHSSALLLGKTGVVWPQGLLDLLYLVVVYLAVALGIQAWRRSPPDVRPALAALNVALALYATGDTLWTWLSLWTQEPTFPSVADVFYLAQYPPLVLALLRLSELSLRRLDAARLVLDAAIVTVVAGLFAWKGGLADLASETTLSALGRTISLAYPLASLAVLGVLILVVSGRQRLGQHVLVFAGGLSLIVVGDLGFAMLEAHDAYNSSSLLDAAWAWGFVLLACGGRLAAQEHRRSPDTSPGGEPQIPPLLSRRLVHWLPYAAVVSLAVFVPQLYPSATLMDRVVAIGVLTVLVLVTLRQGAALTDNRQLNVQLRGAQIRLAHDARHDALTGLLNRAGLSERLREALTPPAASFATLFVDLDRMKRINDAHGHAAGDQMLRVMAGRLRALAPEGAAVARVGGDEFVMVVPGLDRAGVATLAGQLVGAISGPTALASGLAHVTASVGVALYPGDGTQPDDLMRAADMAMYGAKQAGGHHWGFYDEGTLQAAQRDTHLEAALRGALERGELELHYQPLRDLQHNVTVGFEALLRWQPPGGPVPPPEVVRVAEERGLIMALDVWVLRRAAAQVRRWRQDGHDWFVTVNVSALHFAHGDFVSHVRAALDEHDLPGEALVLELTEGALLSDFDSSVADLQRLAAWGVRVALDDFGTGYSSLNYLRRLPVHLVKIDKAFVLSMREEGHAFVQAITVLAHGLNIAVVAEGLEEPWQVEAVSALGVDLGQGFVLGPPAPGHAPARSGEQRPVPAQVSGAPD
ncbi:putative bifunctional diguanylate cyclase/phosphodiesterase [Deinococcus navajonensis]|uniref:Bifunctional diguanylate cyclase/phosphodiesterase n=1 Tax=Deinococcus navajonensis TaxID=309884 RepID=A0ABV8XMA5_9DEIO